MYALDHQGEIHSFHYEPDSTEAQSGRVELIRADGRIEIVICPDEEGFLSEEAVLNLIAIDEFYDALRGLYDCKITRIDPVAGTAIILVQGAGCLELDVS